MTQSRATVKTNISSKTRSFAQWIVGILLLTTAAARAEVRLASPFVDHMVLQRGKRLVIWGTAAANGNVQLHLGEKELRCTANATGEWQVQLDPQRAGGPFECTVQCGNDKAVVHDVMIGDVWLCSGQSNLQMGMKECEDGPATLAIPHRQLRLGRVGQAWTKSPQATAKVEWTAADDPAAQKFSAVAYYFAHELLKDPAMKDVPVGLLEDCLGGTVIESWLPESVLAPFPKDQLQSSMFGIGPTLLYNGMIAPLGQSSFKGVIWYQGEGNAGEPERYARLLPLLFQSWRQQFNDPALPMLVVQLPDYAPDWGGVYWQWIRDSQANAVASTRDAGLVVTINTNSGWNLHPQGKHEIGRRLSLLARQDVYKEPVVGHGPVFKSAIVEGADIKVTFDTDGDSLTSNGPIVNGFSIAGSDGRYFRAEASIKSADTAVLRSPEVPQPATVRYAWAGVPNSTLSNSTGLPAAPFRTDQQPVAHGPDWLLGPFVRPVDVDPVIKPDPGSVFDCPMRKQSVHWEATHTFNPAAIVYDNKVCLLYRAEDNSSGGGIGSYTSRLGLATSEDGLHFTRRPAPVFYPGDDDQRDNEAGGGCEDPRLIYGEDGTIVLTYTQWNRKIPRLAVATTKDLLQWQKYGPALADASGGRYRMMACKSATILGKFIDNHLTAVRINGKYWMYWGEGDMHFATSSDLIHWQPVEDKDGKLLVALNRRGGRFDSDLAEGGPVAILADRGIIVVYNGKNAKDGDKSLGIGAYSGGQALFNPEDPTKLVSRLDVPFYKPELQFERTGQYGAGTTFLEGLVLFKGKAFLYYGCADSFVGVAVCDHP